MPIQNRNGRLSLDGNTLVITNTFTGKRLYITQQNDFVLYIGDRTDMQELASSDFAFSERLVDNAIVREYARGGLNVFVTYARTDETFVKRVSIKSETPVKLCKICVLGGSSSSAFSRGGEGQPVFFDGGFWGGIEFPAALNYYENDILYFTQAPYESTDNFECFPVVFGIDTCGNIESTFNRYIENRAIAKRGIKVYGDWGLHDELSDSGPVLDERLTFAAVDSVRELNEKYGVGIEYYLMDAFWFEEQQPYIDFKKKTFPGGIDAAIDYIEESGMKFGLWFDLSMLHAHMKGMEKYSAELPNKAFDGALCFACEEIASLMKKALIHHIEKHRVKMIKLDFVFFECANNLHDHSQDESESKEKSVKNFLTIVNEIKTKYPDVVFLCYNGFTTNLDWISCVYKHAGYAVSPYWAQYVDYVYCGDPRPCEIATEKLTDSVSYYTDAMIRNFRESAMPFASIDDDGAMIGNTHAIYWQNNKHLRLAWLLGALRGSYKMQLYGDLSLLDDDDKNYIAYLCSVFDDAVNNGYVTDFILGDARRGEVYGYNRHGDTEGYAVAVNPASLEVTQFVKVCDEPISGTVIVRDGKISCEQAVCGNGGFTVSVKPFGYALVKWKSQTKCRRVQKIRLSGGEALSVTAKGAIAVSFTFSDGNKPLRTPRGLPEGIDITVNGKPANSTVRQNIWSGISWVYVTLKGEREVKIRNGGVKPLTVKYELYDKEE